MAQGKVPLWSKASHPCEEQGLLQLALVEFLPNQRGKARIGNRAHLGTVLLLFTLTGLNVPVRCSDFVVYAMYNFKRLISVISSKQLE